MSETIEQTIEQKSSDESRRQVEEAAAQVAELEQEQRDVAGSPAHLMTQSETTARPQSGGGGPTRCLTGVGR